MKLSSRQASGWIGPCRCATERCGARLAAAGGLGGGADPRAILLGTESIRMPMMTPPLDPSSLDQRRARDRRPAGRDSALRVGCPSIILTGGSRNQERLAISCWLSAKKKVRCAHDRFWSKQLAGAASSFSASCQRLVTSYSGMPPKDLLRSTRHSWRKRPSLGKLHCVPNPHIYFQRPGKANLTAPRNPGRA
jgi:hypothetical protein